MFDICLIVILSRWICFGCPLFAIFQSFHQGNETLVGRSLWRKGFGTPRFNPIILPIPNTAHVFSAPAVYSCFFPQPTIGILFSTKTKHFSNGCIQNPHFKIAFDHFRTFACQNCASGVSTCIATNSKKTTPYSVILYFVCPTGPGAGDKLPCCRDPWQQHHRCGRPEYVVLSNVRISPKVSR